MATYTVLNVKLKYILMRQQNIPSHAMCMLLFGFAVTEPTTKEYDYFDSDVQADTQWDVAYSLDDPATICRQFH